MKMFFKLENWCIKHWFILQYLHFWLLFYLEKGRKMTNQRISYDLSVDICHDYFARFIICREINMYINSFPSLCTLITTIFILHSRNIFHYVNIHVHLVNKFYSLPPTMFYIWSIYIEMNGLYVIMCTGKGTRRGKRSNILMLTY